MRRQFLHTFFLIGGLAGIVHAQSPALSEKVLYIQDHYKFPYLITHPFTTPRFPSLFQFPDQIDSFRLYHRYHLEEQNPFYDFKSISHAELRGDSLLVVDGRAYLADYSAYDSLAALPGRYRITREYIKSRFNSDYFRFHTDDSGRRYIWHPEERRLLLRPDEFDRLVVRNFNYWVNSESEKKKVMASKRLAYSVPRAISQGVVTLTFTAFLLFLEAI